jgi:hypothetical protein
VYKRTLRGGGGGDIITFVLAVNNFIAGVSPVFSDFFQQIKTMQDLKFLCSADGYSSLHGCFALSTR